MMLSTRPYLAKAFYQWIVDNNCTPILAANANHPRCKVPVEFIEDGEVVFDVSPSAVRSLDIKADAIHFKASFSGVIHVISIPLNAVTSLYAEENGEGLFFDENDNMVDEPEVLTNIRDTSDRNSQLNDAPLAAQAQVNKKPVLRLVE